MLLLLLLLIIRKTTGTRRKEEEEISFHCIKYDKMNHFQVDKNITRRLDSLQLSRSWDTLLVHYPGLDHLGHIFHPSNTVFLGKLQEMDNSVKKLYNTLTEQVGI